MAKACSSCGKTKPERAFPDDGRTKDGLSASCITCKAGSSFAALETVDLAGVEIAEADITVHGGGSPPEGDTYSVTDLEQIAADSNSVCADLRPPVKIGHNREQRLLRASGLWDEEPRSGTLNNFRVVGKKLVCDIQKMPRKLADLVQSDAFRLRSMELGPARSQRENKTFGTVVRGLALLGTVTPAFQTLDDIHAMYAGVERERTDTLIFGDMPLDEESRKELAITNYAVGDVVWDSEDGVQDIMADVAAQLNPGSPDSFPRYWVMDLQLIDVDGDGDVPGPRALVGEYGSGAAWVVPLTFDSDGEPVVPPSADWVLAEQAWVQTAPSTSDAPGESSDETTDMNEGPDDSADTRSNMPAKPQSTKVERPDLTEEQVAAFAKMFNLDGDDATAEKVYEALEAAATKQPEPKADPKPEPGTRSMSESEYAELREMAERGVRADRKLHEAERESLIGGKIREGRLDPADKKFYEERYEQDPELVRHMLERLPVNEDLLRVYGGDGDGLDQPSSQDEAQYRVYCERNGIPYIGGPRKEAA